MVAQSCRASQGHGQSREKCRFLSYLTLLPHLQQHPKHRRRSGFGRPAAACGRRKKVGKKVQYGSTKQILAYRPAAENTRSLNNTLSLRISWIQDQRSNWIRGGAWWPEYILYIYGHTVPRRCLIQVWTFENDQGPFFKNCELAITGQRFPPYLEIGGMVSWNTPLPSLWLINIRVLTRGGGRWNRQSTSLHPTWKIATPPHVTGSFP